jgi:hypothetical protein
MAVMFFTLWIAPESAEWKGPAPFSRSWEQRKVLKIAKSAGRQDIATERN